MGLSDTADTGLVEEGIRKKFLVCITIFTERTNSKT